MRRWLTAFVYGFLLTAGQSLRAEEEVDPFAETTPPATVQSLTPPPRLSSEPALITPIPHRPALAVEPSPAQQRVHARAAQAAQERKAKIEQRRYGVPSTAQTFFPSDGWLVSRSLYPVDPGIRIAFRPIDLSGLDPIPSVQPSVRPTPKRVTPKTTPPRSEPSPRE